MGFEDKGINLMGGLAPCAIITSHCGRKAKLNCRLSRIGMHEDSPPGAQDSNLRISNCKVRGPTS
jgi:hypothetical protein